MLDKIDNCIAHLRSLEKATKKTIEDNSKKKGKETENVALSAKMDAFKEAAQAVIDLRLEVELAPIIAKLGETFDSAVAEIQRANIRGYRNQPWCCPVARYISSQFEKFCIVVGEFVRIGDAKARLPKNVVSVVLRFDLGEIPELQALLKNQDERTS